jgi:hypothetical protein
VKETSVPDIERFVELLDRHGSDRARWPEADARFADALLETSVDARRALARAERLEAWLDDALRTPEPDVRALRARILAALPLRDPVTRFFAWLARGPLLWRPVAMALVPLVLGFTIGISASEPAGNDAELVMELQLFAFQDAEASAEASAEAYAEAYDDAQ